MASKYEWETLMPQFDRLIEAGDSINAACRKLNIPPSSLHNRMRSLDKQIGAAKPVSRAVDWVKVGPHIEAAKARGETYTEACRRLGVNFANFLSHRQRVKEKGGVNAMSPKDQIFVRLWRLKTSYSVIAKRTGIAFDDVPAHAERLNLGKQDNPGHAKYDWRTLDPQIIERLDAGVQYARIAEDLEINLATLNKRILGVLRVSEPQRIVMPLDEITLRNEARWVAGLPAHHPVKRAMAGAMA
ncbi:MAG TPA: hypothetical protein PK677_11290 [Acidiphilium sp.]|nr:hypothetical protein [Acidiphilium sp.]